MAGGANAAFLADPIGFMQNNIIRVTYNGPATSVPLEFDLVDSGIVETKKDKKAGFSKNAIRDRTWTGVSAAGDTMKVYDLIAFSGKLLRPFAHPIKAYWLAFKSGEVETVRLGPAARFLFTATLNGCSIGVGDGQHPKVCHANKWIEVESVRKTDQTLMDLQIRQAIYGGRTLLPKSDYSVDGKKINVTFIGVFKNDRWKFYWQSHNGQLDEADGYKGTVTVTEREAVRRVK